MSMVRAIVLHYAMFDAARAALLASDAPVAPDIGRTHSGLIGAFSNHLVKNGPVSKEMGRLLNRAQEMVAQAEAFIAALRAEFLSDDSCQDE